MPTKNRSTTITKSAAPHKPGTRAARLDGKRRRPGERGTPQPDAPKTLVIEPPNLRLARFKIRGTAPYVQNRFPAKVQRQIEETQEAGKRASKAKGSSNKKPKDFKANYRDAMHISCEGWHGIPAPAFRNAMIAACKLTGYAMTRAKLSVFIVADGFDADDSTPLVKITKGKPEYFAVPVRNDSGVVDIRPRPRWMPGWEAMVTIRYDADQFSETDVANLLLRAAIQVGVGEGRPDSKKSNGLGWGTFEIVGEK